MQNNYYSSNYTKYLRANLRENSIDPKETWQLISQASKLTFESLPQLRPVFMSNLKECGEVAQFESAWDKATPKKPQELKNFEGVTFEESIYDDPKMRELIDNNVADVFTTDVVAAAMMVMTKSNYSFDLEIRKGDGKIFIDRRQADDEDEGNKYSNIMNYNTVCESSVDFQP